MEILGGLLSSADGGEADARPEVGLSLSAALNLLARREQYLALEQRGMRLDIGVKYGLLSAQIALALNGRDRDEMLTRLLELLMARSMQEGEGPGMMWVHVGCAFGWQPPGCWTRTAALKA